MTPRERMQTALESVLGVEKVTAEEHIGKSLPDEYAVYQQTNQFYVKYADGKPKIRRTDITVSYLHRDINKKLTRPAELEAAAVSVGFRVRSTDSDIPRDDGSPYYGTSSDFSYFEVVT